MKTRLVPESVNLLCISIIFFNVPLKSDLAERRFPTPSEASFSFAC